MMISERFTGVRQEGERREMLYERARKKKEKKTSYVWKSLP